MAMLRNEESGAIVPLAARVVVGRASTAQLVLADKRVSGEHATLVWAGHAAGWEIRDLGSRNGTFVDGARLVPGESWPLAAGARISFGADEPVFLLLEASAPGPVARDPGGTFCSPVDGLLALPAPEDPQAVVYADHAGRFVLEAGDERRAVVDGESVVVGGVPYTLSLPGIVEGTATADAGPMLDTATLRFGVSRDEEHVQLSIVHRGRATALEPREHGYVLLTLARQRLEDRDEPPSEQGWIDRDQLLRMLQLDANGLNVAIYRARGQLAAAGLEGAAGIVEVRRGQRRIGVPPERLEIGPLD
ncbi:MAG: FHA domain-containing protein [Alphaproteobacteria bacterium]|nr:FHA domain-containing protein [Alphaproteobacteria bacterium]MCB9699235.1 FHA domain-containing protein [Alphaproteobacteria bacterium]